MSLIDLIVNKGLEALGRYYGTYRAIVMDSEFDEQNRLHIICPSISKVPILAYPQGQDGSLDSGFKWFTPSPGQVVYIQFIQGDLEYPVWSHHGWAKDEIPKELSGKGLAGFKSKRGHLVVLDEDEGYLKISITEPNGNDEPVITTMTLGAEVSIECNKRININTPETILNGGELGGVPISSKVADRISILEKSLNDLANNITLTSPAILALAPTWVNVATWATSTKLTYTKSNDIANNNVKQ